MMLREPAGTPDLDDGAARWMDAALAAPSGVTAGGLEVLCGRRSSWVRNRLARSASAVGTDWAGRQLYRTRQPVAAGHDLAVTLIAAAGTIIVDREFGAGDMCGPRGEVDILGAVRVAAGAAHPADMPDDPALVDAVHTAEQLIGEVLPGPGDWFARIAVWTDQPGRTGDQVLALLRARLDAVAAGGGVR
jgi:hypothetical protein